MTVRRPQWTRPSSWSTVRQAAAALILVAAVSFAVVGTAAFVIAHRIARADALSEGLRTARGVGQALLAPAMPAVVAGDAAAAARAGRTSVHDRRRCCGGAFSTTAVT